MAIARVANISFTAAASTTTTTVKSAALFGSVLVGDQVYNSTRGLYGHVTVWTDASTITCSSIAGQTTGDSITIKPLISITGNFQNGTSTAIGVTSITNSGAPWTASALIDRTIRITSGSFATAIGLVSANTTTVATVERWVQWNTTTKVFEAVTPTGTPTYEVAYNFADIVTALGGDCSWLNTTTKKHIRFTDGGGLKLTDATAFFADVDCTVELQPMAYIWSMVVGNCYVFGKFNSDIRGSSGGELIANYVHNSTVDAYMYGLLYLLGCVRKINKLQSYSSYPRWNASQTTGTDGIIIVDSVLRNGQILHQTNDIYIRTTGEVDTMAVRSEGRLLDSPVVNSGNFSLAGKYGVNGIQGGKLSYPKVYGSKIAGAGQRYIWFDSPIMPFQVHHIFSPLFGTGLTALDDFYDIYNSNTIDQFTATVGTDATNVYSASELTTTGVGDYLYNVTRSAVACILTKPTNIRATTRSITGQTTGDTIQVRSRFQFNSYIHKATRTTTVKTEDGTALGAVAVGIMQSSDNVGQIVTSISTDNKLVTLTAGTTTTTLMCTGNAFSTVSVGDRIYNHTLQNYRVVLTKVSDNELTCDALTSQASGDSVCFSSSLPYAPVKKRFVQMDGSGTYASTFDTSKGLCVAYSFTKFGTKRFNSVPTYIGTLRQVVIKYGRVYQSAPIEIPSNGAEVVNKISMTVNPYVVASEATARAYTGIAFSGTTGAMIVTLSSSKTPQEIYDYHEVWLYDEAVNNDNYYPPFITAVSAGVFDFGTTVIVIASGGTLTVDTDTAVGAIKFGTRPVTASQGILVQASGTLVVGQAGSQGRSIDFASTTMLPSPFLTHADIAIDTDGVWNWISTEIQSHVGIRIKGSITISTGNAKLINEGNRVNAGGIPTRFTIDENNQLTDISNLETIYCGITVLKTATLLTNASLENSLAGLIVGGGAPDNVWVDVSAISFITNTLDIGTAGNQWLRFSNSVAGTDIIVAGYSVAAGAGNQGLVEMRQQVKFYLADGAKAYTVDTDNGDRLAVNLVGTNPDYVADRSYTLTASGGYAEYTTDGGVLTGVFWRTVDTTRWLDNHFDSRGLANDRTDVFSWLFVEYGKQVSVGNHILKGATEYESTPQFLPDLGITQATKATVAAYTGISAVYSTGTLTVTFTTDHVWNEGYDFIKYYESENPSSVWENAKTSFVSTSNKLSYTYSNIVIVVDGCRLIADGQSLPTKPTVINDGFFEDADGVIWADGADTYYASHAYVQAVDGITASPIQYVAVGWGDLPTQTQLLYNTSLALTGLETDATGKAEGYFVYKINATTYANTKMVLGEYNYQFLTVPRTITGSQIGSTSSYEVNRLSTDNQVTLSKAAALAVSGVTVTHGSKLVNCNDVSLSNLYDNLKARQAAITDIEAGVTGCLSYCVYGLLISKVGTNYTAIDDWTYSNVGDSGKFIDGKIIFDIPGIAIGDYDNVNFDFSVAGTYDFRTVSIVGTSILTNSSGGSVTVQLHPDHLYTNTGPDITVQSSLSVSITAPNLINGTRVQIYNVTQAAEIDNSLVSGGSGYSYAASLGTGYDAENGDIIRIRATFVSGASAAKEELTNSGAISESGITFVDGQTDDEVYIAWAVDGSSVTEFSADYPNVQVDINDPDNQTTKKRLGAWLKYIVITEDGIRNFFGAVTTQSAAEIKINIDVVDLKLDNVSGSEVYFTDLDVRLYRSDLTQIIASGSDSIFLDYSGVPFIVDNASDALTLPEFLALK
jgi:hypothetical protein